MSKLPTTPRTRLSALAGILGAAVALTVVTGAGPVASVFQLTGATEDVRGSCDEAEHADDAACVGVVSARGQDDSSSSSTSTTLGSSSSTIPGSSTAGQPPAGADVRTVRAADAGSVLVSVDGATLRLLTATPSQGWRAFVEQASGREVEVTFRSGTRRVDLNLELEDGQLRERVRTRDDATDTRSETTNGVVTDDSSSSGSGSSDDDSGSSSDDDSSDDSGTGSDSDDDSDDDNSGSGSDDSSDDDSGSGSDDSSDDDNSGSGSDDADDSSDDSSDSSSSSDDSDDDNSGSDDGPNHT